MKLRIYDDNLKPKGTFIMDEHKQRITLQFNPESEFNDKFKKVINSFLKRNNLKIVSGTYTRTRHCNNSKRHVSKDFNFYKLIIRITLMINM